MTTRTIQTQHGAIRVSSIIADDAEPAEQCVTEARADKREREIVRCERCCTPIRSKRLLRLASMGYRARCARCDREAQRT